MLEFLEEIAQKAEGKMPPTTIYNEGWMLRLVLDWFEQNSQTQSLSHELSFYPRAVWYSEALLPTQFKRIPKNEPKAQAWNKLAETHTNVDGVIGHFRIGTEGRKGNLELLDCAEQFVVVEAKMFSPLASGTSNIPGYNQAARNVACMAEVLRVAGRDSLPDLKKLGFYILAPEEHLASKRGRSFHEWISKKSLEQVILQRIEQYRDIDAGNKQLAKFEEYVRFVIREIDTKCICWESIVEAIMGTEQFSGYGNKLESFYGNCMKYNRSADHTTVEGP